MRKSIKNMAVQSVLQWQNQGSGSRTGRETGKVLISEGTLLIPHAHTVSVEPLTHLVYFPLQNIDGHPVLRIMEPSKSTEY